jgi:hypothetical protein
MRPLPHLTATSAADPSRQSSASITITSNFTLQIAAPANLAPGVTSATVATTTPVPGSRARRRKCRTHLWSMPGPVHFDGNYEIDRLPVGRSYKVYVEPLGGAVAPSEGNQRRWLRFAAMPRLDTAFTTVRGLELAIHKDCGAVGESLSLEGLSYRNVVATAHAIQSTKHLGNCGD